MNVPGVANVTATGAFTYSIPIVVPPGTAGIVPSLSLNYSSAAGDGFEGLGWFLGGLSAITRCPRTLAQDGIHGGVNYDAGTGGNVTNDRFCLDGQRLILTSGHYGADGSLYRTEIESFTEVIAHCDVPGTCSTANGPDWFEVHTKSGRILQFGNMTVPANGSRILISNPPAGSLPIVREWLENNCADLSGNYFSVTYDSTQQGYPTEIDYTGNASSSVFPYNKVEFIYATRSDVYKTYQAGSFTEMTQLLKNIETFAGTTLVSNYVLGYSYAAANSAQHNELNSVSRCSDSGGTTCLAPTTFGWQGSRDTITVQPGIPISLAQGGTVAPGDWNGDGLTDAIVDAAQDDPCNIYFGSQSNTFTASTITANYEKWINGSGKWVTGQAACFDTFATFTTPPVTDFSGDGFTDLIITQVHDDGNYFQALENNQQGVLIQATTNAAFSMATFTYIYGVADFNGDGLSDVAAPISSGIFDTGSLYYSNGDGTFAPGATFPVNLLGLIVADFDGDGCSDYLSLDVTYSCNPAIPSVLPPSLSGTVLAGDFNGDGKDDILDITTSGTVNLYYSTGTGFTAAIPEPDFAGTSAIYIGDFNGDGKMDVALIAGAGSSSTIYLGTGNGFVQAKDASGHPVSITSPGSYVVGTVVADWNNDGATDLWIQSRPDSSGNGDAIFNISYVPELITSVSNGLCVSPCTTTQVAYDRLNHGTTIYTKGSGATYPTQDVINASYVVSKISSNNGVGGTNSVSYTYVGAKADLKGRGFLGFTTVKATDSRTGLVTTTSFSTLFPLTGTPTEQVVMSGTTTLTDTQFTYTPTNLGGTRNLVELTEKKQVAHNNLDGSNMPITDTTYTYDSYANPHVVTSTVTTHAGSGGAVSSITTQTSTWTNYTSGTNWVLGQPLEQDTESNIVGVTDCSVPANCTRHLSFVTDHPTGLVKTATIESGSSIYLETDYTYDAFGNRHTITQKGADIATRTTTLNYDSNGEFPTSINYPMPSSGIAQTVFLGFDSRFGSMTSYKDVNSQTKYWVYDAFGRVIAQINPDSTGTQVSYTYCSGINGGSASCAANGAYYINSLPVLCTDLACDTGTTIGPFSKITSDMLLRPILRESQGFDTTGISQSTVYGPKLNVHETSRPIFTGGTYAYTNYHYDALGRVTETDFPDGSSSTYSYTGLTSSVTNDKGQTTTTLLNPQGLVGTVTDATTTGQTTYVYDGFGDPTDITSNGHAIVNTFDIRGRKLTAVDSDMGSSAHPWVYTYDALSELLTQTDAQSNQTTMNYDVLGRPTSRTEADYTTTWNWDTATNGVGKLAQACNAAPCAGANYIYTPTYDSVGRISTDALLINGTTYTYALSYDTDQRLGHVVYPSGFRADYQYTSLGYLSNINDHGTGAAIWTANTADAELHLLQATAANQVVTNQEFSADTGNLERIQVGTSSAPTSITWLSYDWDTIGNLTSRTDHHGTNSTDSFCYDQLNRLTSYGPTTSTSCPVTVSGAVTLTYSGAGNISSKSDVGTYSYGAGSAGPHAVTSIAGTVAGTTNPNFIYDQNGNMKCMTAASSCNGSAARSMAWTSFNKLASLSDSFTGDSFALAYDTNHARIRQCSPDCTSPTSETDYINDPATGTMEEKVVSGSTTAFNDYVQAAGSIVAMRTLSGGSASYLYFTGDHLGSIAIITDASGSLISGGRQSYDSWGLRRGVNGGPAAACNSISSATTRGYTQQEEIDSSCLVNLNGRIYDPTVGRFLSADPTIPDPYNTQSYNRYSYVNNGPLSLIDPTGYGSPIGGCTFENGCSETVYQINPASGVGGGGGATGGDIPSISLDPASGDDGDESTPEGYWGQGTGAYTDANGVDTVVMTLTPVYGTDSEGVSAAFDAFGIVVDTQKVVASGLVAISARGITGARAISSMEKLFGGVGAVAVLGQQGFQARSEINAGAPVGPTVVGVGVNTTLIVGASFGTTQLVEFAIGEAIDPAGGGFIAVGVGALAGIGVASTLPGPSTTGQFVTGTNIPIVGITQY